MRELGSSEKWRSVLIIPRMRARARGRSREDCDIPMRWGELFSSFRALLVAGFGVIPRWVLE